MLRGQATQNILCLSPAAIAELLLEQLEAVGTPGLPLDLHGRSDHGPFLRAGAGIPTGGVYSGGSEPMPADDAAIFGGEANEPMAPCYHLACDTLEGVNSASLDVLGDVLAHALAELASSRFTPTD